VYYIFYWKDGKKIEKPVGRQYKDSMTPSRASLIRAQKVNNQILPNKQRREDNQSHKPFKINDLWIDYCDTHTHFKRLHDQRYLFEKHLRDRIGDKPSNDLTIRDSDNLKKDLQGIYKPQTVKHVLSIIIKRLVNHGVARNLCTQLTFKIQMTKFDNRKTEDLTPGHLHKLFEVLEEEPNA